ncbi:MAG TPA: type IV pili methyl-accepting chemotaxis transducer N-terminal domain-containing protein [Polyangiaceae bacterium]|nr:type IV pili methyl-accepting chemotaxis transducer N-terminal domain-containing protein [Polyangiaceae bacterium]
MKIRHVLTFGASTFLLLLVLLLGATGYLFAFGGSDALYVNLAGRQRMLSQKISKESLLLARGPSAEARAALERSIAIFERTHRALRMSGSAPLSLDNTNDADVVGPTNFALLAKLDQVGSLWSEMATIIRDVEQRAEALATARDTLARECPRLLAAAEKVVRLETELRDASPRLVNLAGRQRMLSQKLGFDALLYAQEPSQPLREQLEEDLRIFTKSHRALRYGGDAQLDAGARETTFVAAASDPAIVKALDGAEEIWQRVAPAVGVVLAPEGLHASLVALTELNPRLLKTMDEAVTLAQHLADSKVKLLRQLQIGTSAIGLVLVLLAIGYSNRMGRAFSQLKAAAEEISLGQLATPVDTHGQGEVGELARSFERMRSSLEAAISDLEDRQELGIG